MTETRSSLGLMTGVILTTCLAVAACAPTPAQVTRTVSTEQVTTTIPPPPPPPVMTTTTENVTTPVATPHRRWARDNDVDEETTETIVPAVIPVPPQTITRTTTQSTTGQ
jgi:hypothetical protein